MIVETFHLAATDADLLSSPSRLAAIPYSGQLTLEFQSNLNDATNSWDVSIQLPDGSTPLEAGRVQIPAGATAGALNREDKYTVTFPATQGGHILVGCTENGTALLTVRATLMP